MSLNDLFTGPTLYTWSFFIALAIFLIGMICRITGFFRFTIGADQTELTMSRRIRAFLSGVLGIIVSPVRMFHLFRAVVLDVILQLPLLRQDLQKWIMHITIFWGFAGLFFFHALDDYVSRAIFSGYESTLSPFMFLRNAAGVVVMVGVAIAIYRRKTHFRLKQISRQTDYLAIALIATIMLSGFGLEATRIISPDIFDEMVEEYASLDEEELPALKAVWQEAYNVQFPGEYIRITPELMEEGESLNEDNCISCHANPRGAFVSYTLSIVARPFAGVLSRNRIDLLMLTIHFLSCFIALAYLPFSKFLHILTTPVSLVISAVSGQQVRRDENRATRRVFDLSACTRCGTCTSHCAVGPLYEILETPWVLPSERIARINTSLWGIGVASEPPELRDAFSRGTFLCTMCNKCSQLCPAGLDLQDIWQATRDQLTSELLADPATRIRRRIERDRSGKSKPDAPVVVTPGRDPGFESLKASLKLSFQAVNFSQCYACLTCSSSCPLTGVSGRPRQSGSSPHQVIHALVLGQIEQAGNAAIVWDCLTCYKCQENCPQGVRITDIFYQLKNIKYHQEFGI